MVMLGLAKDQYQSGNFDKCRETLEEALRMDDKNAPIHILMAKVDIEQGQFDMAEDELTAARKIDSKNAESDYLSGVIYQRWQQPDKALEFYQSAVAKNPSELAYLMAKAETLVAMGHQDEALALLQSKVVYFEHSAVIRDAVGMLLVGKHELPKAVDMFRSASILSPDDLTIRLHLAMALYQNQQYVDASDMFQELIKEDAFAKRADLRLTLAECDLALGRIVESRTAAQAACDLDASLPFAWLTLAKTSLALGDQFRTQMSIGKALALDPENSEGYLLMGYLHLRQGKLQEALNNFTHSAELDPTNSVAFCMTGFCISACLIPKKRNSITSKLFNSTLKTHWRAS
jgi:tetratricopeptide (TPR) repeat protein